jgi:GNAT superfamily N-acetyltransferase
MHTRPYEAGDLDAVVGLSLRAWEPVCASIESAMDAAVFSELHPDWRMQQQIAVAAVCTESDAHVWVAVVEETPAGFVACKRQTEQLGEISMIAVDPAFQRRGIATALIQFAIGWMRDKGISVAMLETGGDPGHAAARRTYEACGFHPLSVARYFKKLEPIEPRNASDSANSAPRPPIGVEKSPANYLGPSARQFVSQDRHTETRPPSVPRAERPSRRIPRWRGGAFGGLAVELSIAVRSPAVSTGTKTDVSNTKIAQLTRRFRVAIGIESKSPRQRRFKLGMTNTRTRRL